MSLKHIFMALFVVSMSFGLVQSAYANDEGKSCKADTDCEHGEHCKDGQCHK